MQSSAKRCKSCLPKSRACLGPQHEAQPVTAFAGFSWPVAFQTAALISPGDRYEAFGRRTFVCRPCSGKKHKSVFVRAFGHAYGRTVMLGDVRTMRLTSRTVIEGVRAALTDQCVKLHLPPRQLFHSSLCRPLSADSRRQCANAVGKNEACALLFFFFFLLSAPALQKVLILPRLAAT